MLTTIIIMMVLCGSASTIIGKLMSQEVETTSDDGTVVTSAFRHPLVMNVLMFVGEASLLLYLRLYQMSNPERT